MVSLPCVALTVLHGNRDAAFGSIPVEELVEFVQERICVKSNHPWILAKRYALRSHAVDRTHVKSVLT